MEGNSDMKKKFRRVASRLILAQKVVKNFTKKANNKVFNITGSEKVWPSDDKFLKRRLSGLLNFKYNENYVNDIKLDAPLAFENPTEKALKENKVTYVNQFKKYCLQTTLHGYRYIMEDGRHRTERLFWICWCTFGIIAAGYMMSKIWTKWERNPTVTTVATTNFPVAGLEFPAVTICTVNKAVTEKMVIQACRANMTLTQMHSIISRLIDPEARYNDHEEEEKVNVKPEMALKYLQLVTPKCDDFLLICRWNSRKVFCKDIFRLVLTDAGFCCSFNSMEIRKARKDSKYDEEVEEQEREFEYLQRAVWEYAKKFQKNSYSPSWGNKGNKKDSEKSDEDAVGCNRDYTDMMFPGVCFEIQQCRDDPTICQAQDNQTTKADRVGYNGEETFTESFPLTASGAGRSRGLTLMLDTLRCGTVPTDSFKGLRVHVHNGDDFPAVAEKGYIVGPGKETQISVNAIDTYSRGTLRKFHPSSRGCFFPDEFKLKYYKEYSRSACIVECETEYVHQECKCITYFNPGNYSICDEVKFKQCVKKSLDKIQKKTLPPDEDQDEDEEPVEGSSFSFKEKSVPQQEKSCADYCLPACNETFYNILLTSADFPNQPVPNQTKVVRDAISIGLTHLDDISYIQNSIGMVHVYFHESSIMQYKRDELFTWEDFVSNLGGVMSLCMGFSISSVIEFIYFFTYRMHVDKKQYRERVNAPEVFINPERI